jgi:hemerythrin-like domain-containing protein
MAQAMAMDPVLMLKEDHQKVKQLFEEFEQTNNSRSKQRIAREAIMELEIHAALEEQIFYPAFEGGMQEKEAQQILAEAEEEHHVAHLLIGELKDMSADDDHFEAKFKVLAENVRHHIKEEETMMLPKAASLGKEQLTQLGEQMLQKKQQLKKELKAEAAAPR